MVQIGTNIGTEQKSGIFAKQKKPFGYGVSATSKCHINKTWSG